MTIDACTRIWPGDRPWPRAAGRDTPEQRRIDIAAYERAMRPVDAAFVLGHRADRLDINVPHEHIAAFVNRVPDRRIGFAGIDPLASDPATEIDRAIDLALTGIVVSPADAGCRPTHDRFFRTLEHAATRSLPVIISNPALLHPRSSLEFAHHALLDDALATIPRLRLLLSDLALVPIEETLSLLAKHQHAFAETSALIGRPAHLHQTLLLAHERGVADKILFGSGFPDTTPARALEDLYRANTGGTAASTSITPAVPRATLQLIVERDPLPLLAIDAHTIRRRAHDTDHTPLPERSRTNHPALEETDA